MRMRCAKGGAFRRGCWQQRVALAAASVAVAAATTACAAQPVSVPESEPTAAPAAQTAPAIDPAPISGDEAAEPDAPIRVDSDFRSTSSLPEAFFGVEMEEGLALANAARCEVPLQCPAPDEKMTLLTPCAEGLALAAWETSDTYSEWDTVHGRQTHYGLVDASGAVAVDLDAAMASLSISGLSSAKASEAAFADGRLVVSMSTHGEGQRNVTVVLDHAGKVVFAMGRSDTLLSEAKVEDQATYHDDVLSLGSSEGDLLVDVDGKVLASQKEVGSPLVSLGYGWYMRESGEDGKVYDYDGAAVFDAASAVGKDADGVRLRYEQPEGCGIVCVEAERRGARMRGLYSMDASAWIVPLGEDLNAYSSAHEDLIWTRTKSSQGDGAPARSAIMDAEGVVAFDAAMAPAELSVPEDFVAQYLCDGWWSIRDEAVSEPYALVYLDDGAYVGATAAPAHLVDYPTSEIYWL